MATINLTNLPAGTPNIAVDVDPSPERLSIPDNDPITINRALKELSRINAVVLAVYDAAGKRWVYWLKH